MDRVLELLELWGIVSAVAVLLLAALLVPVSVLERRRDAEELDEPAATPPPV